MLNCKRAVMRRLPFALFLLACATGATQPFSPALVEQIMKRVSPALCEVTYSYEITDRNSGEIAKRDSAALGVIVREDGLVMVRGHVAIENVEPFNIHVKVGRHGEDRQEYEAELLPKPDDVNVVFLKILADTPRTFPAVRFADRPVIRVGEPLLIFGLMGQTFDNQPGFYVRYVNSSLDSPRVSYSLDQPVPLGFIGGPAVNTHGLAVGVPGFDLSREEGGELYVRSQHPLLYQADLFVRYFKEPPKSEPTPWLGVFTQPLTDDLAEYWGLPKKGGIVISTIVPGSPAAQAGLQRGDVIVKFNNESIRAKENYEVLDFTRAVREAGAGAKVPVEFYRNGRLQTVETLIQARPKARREAERQEDTALGLVVEELTQDFRIQFNLSDDTEGVVIYRTRSGGPAALAGLRPRMIIQGIGNAPVRNLDEFRAVTQKLAQDKPKEVSVFCRIGQQTGFFRVNPRW